MKSFQYTETKYMLTVQETARVLGVNVHTIYRLINSGELSTIKVSPRKTVIKAEEIERAIPHNEPSVKRAKKNTRQKCRVSREIFRFLRKDIQNQTNGKNLSARYRFANANTIFCFAVCFFKPRYRVLR